MGTDLGFLVGERLVRAEQQADGDLSFVLLRIGRRGCPARLPGTSRMGRRCTLQVAISVSGTGVPRSSTLRVKLAAS